MAFKLNKKVIASIKDPEVLFRDLRERTVEGLLSQQADMLRLYMPHADSKDVALELPTGSGKTLVGLLIAEWRRRAKRERCVYVCPTKQLVNQVVEQSNKKYGIKALNFAGSSKEFSEQDKSVFLNCEAIGVATYSALFNTNSFFADIATVIFDDAHAADNYISSLWTLEINRTDPGNIYSAIIKLIEESIPFQDQVRLDSDDSSHLDYSIVNKLCFHPRHKHNRCCSIVDAGSIAGGDCAILLEGRAKLTQRFKAGIDSRMFIGIEGQ